MSGERGGEVFNGCRRQGRGRRRRSLACQRSAGRECRRGREYTGGARCAVLSAAPKKVCVWGGKEKERDTGLDFAYNEPGGWRCRPAGADAGTPRDGGGKRTGAVCGGKRRDKGTLVLCCCQRAQLGSGGTGQPSRHPTEKRWGRLRKNGPGEARQGAVRSKKRWERHCSPLVMLVCRLVCLFVWAGSRPGCGVAGWQGGEVFWR